MMKYFTTIFIGILFSGSIFGQTSEFVKLRGDHFELNGEPFFALSVNYGAKIAFKESGVYFVRPQPHYRLQSQPKCSTQEECDERIIEDFLQIKEMGFNSIRIFGLGFSYDPDNDATTTDPPVHIAPHYNNWNSKEEILLIEPYTELIDAIEHILELAALPEIDLKVQLLAGANKLALPNISEAYEDYLAYLADYFKDNPTIYSYEFVNEPEWDQSLTGSMGNLDRNQVCDLTEQWNNAVKSNCRYQSTTISLYGSKSVKEYNPGLMHVDFISHHLYPKIRDSDGSNKQQKAIDRVRSEIKWVSDASTLPWMVGEIGYSSNNVEPSYQSENSPHGTFQHQKDFAQETLNTVRDCGGLGYIWWQFHDAPGYGGAGNDRSTYYGLVRENDDSFKPAVEVFQNFNPDIQGNYCIKPWGYHNYYGYTTLSKFGYVVDQNMQPIEHAVIYGWNSYGSYRTFSRDNGYFELYTYQGIQSDHFQISAVGASTTNSISFITNSYMLEKFDPVRDLVVSGVVVNEGDPNYNIEAENTIYASNILIDGDDIVGGNSSMKAETVIRLGTDFVARRGSHFHAYNASVYPTCNAVDNFYQSPIEDDNTYSTPDKSKTETKDIPNQVINDINVYPNPNNGRFLLTLKNPNNIKQVEIYNTIGQAVYETSNIIEVNSIDLSNHNSGIYFIKVISSKDVSTFQITIN